MTLTFARFPPSSRLALGFVVLLTSVGSTRSEAQRLGEEVQINVWTTNDQEAPSVGGASNGEFVVAWSSYGQDPDCDIYGGYTCDVLLARRVSATGGPIGGEIRVGTAHQSQSNAAVARSADGDFVVAWNSWFHPASGLNVSARRFDAEGNAVGPVFQIGSAGSNLSNREPAVDRAPDGEFVVVWQQYSFCCEWGVYGRRFDATGEPVGELFTVRPTEQLSQGQPDVAMGESGSFVVTWVEQTLQAGLRVSARRYDEGGLPLDDGVQVNEGGNTPGVTQIGMDDSGGFVIAWDRGNAANEREIAARQFDTDGLPLGPEFQVNSYTTGLQWNAAVGVDGAGRFLVVWQSESQDGSDLGIFAQAFDADGERIGTELRVNAWTTGAQSFPSVAAAGSDRFLVAWQSVAQDGSSSGIFARVVELPLFADGFESGDTSGWSCTSGDGCPSPAARGLRGVALPI